MNWQITYIILACTTTIYFMVVGYIAKKRGKNVNDWSYKAPLLGFLFPLSWIFLLFLASEAIIEGIAYKED